MSVVFDDTVSVHYRQIYVLSDPENFLDGPNEPTDGQKNGLCGAATPGLLFLTTGLHSGEVGFTVEVHDERPPVSAPWEDVVEVPFRPITDHVLLCQWAGEMSWPIPLRTINYRVRYCATGMDRASGGPDTEEIVDRYLLQSWPANPSPDEIIRVGGKFAAYYHTTPRPLKE